eukprot:CAMPEP_0194083176 /NCGR_PEP_ID=MMETSP0149-20130528/8490_1 /TAXON_ID=122233 /ORGANISM="Chaetoceros debilis, Strain MM31A-1" /LENGTH=636 /DNA_ID=CAMNT_0038765517 /DNA_START=67 /DNA_END=1977 /DNA_ORIENTATION=+
MSYQNTGGYQNLPTDGNQAAVPGAPSAADTSMSYPNPNANTNNNAEGGNGGNPQHPLQQQVNQQQVNQQQVNQQQVNQQQQQVQHQQQQQQFQNPPNQAFNGSAGRVQYNMPTYHQYSNGNGSGNPNSNIYGGSGMGGQGMPPMGSMPSTFNAGGNYGPNIGSAAWSQYMQQSKRNRILVTVLVTIFVLYLFSPGSGSGSGSANPYNSAAASAGANAGANHLSLETVAKNEDAVTNYQHSSGIPGDGLKPTTSASSTTTNVPDADMEMAGDGALTLSESPRFAYLLTYPMSGTSYSMYLASKSTHKAIGTNYAIYGQQGDNGYAMPILKSALLPSTSTSSEPASSSYGKQKQVTVKPTDSNGSPYWWRFTYSKMDKPDPSSDIILVNTHCSGHCMYPCAPEEFTIAPEPFEETCRLVIGAPPTYHVSLTPQADVAKIIHLLRDPYSNVVSRFHSWRREATAAHIDKSRIHADTMDGFHAWCKDMDKNELMDALEILSPQITVGVKEIMLDVPCHSEFFKYVSWHNNVVAMEWMDSVNGMHVYYEDYADASKQKKIATDMAEFLGTPLSSSESDAASTLPDFLKVRMYGDWFTAKDKENVEKFVRTLAIKPAMPLLERYFGSNAESRNAKDEEVGQD